MKHNLRSFCLLILLSFCIAFPIWNFNYLKKVEANDHLGLRNIRFSAYIENHSNTFLFNDINFFSKLNHLLISESIGLVYMSTGDGSPKVAVYGDLSTIDWIPTDFKKNVAYNLSPNKNITSLFLPNNIQLSEYDLNIPSLYDGISYLTWLENDYLTTGEYYFTSKQMLSDEKISKITNLFEEREFILKGLKLNDNIFKDHPLLTLGIFISILAIVLYSIRLVYELINLHPLLQQYWLYNATPIIIMKYFVCSIAILPLMSSFIASSLVYAIEYEIFKSTPASNDYIIMFFSISAACLICNFIIYISYIHFVYQTAEKV